MSFEPRNFDQIVSDLQSRSAPVITDFAVGSVARTLYESFAYEIALLYEKMNLVYLSAFVDTAESAQLDMVVGVLGLRRGLPDFATGVVTFQRDVGNTDIEIPVNTLVATEDSESKPRQIYQTLEPAFLAQDAVSVDVRVQAQEPGETQAADPQAISVMPRPLPGIKAVTNREPIRFNGKRRETDDELRIRAKNALIASGKATLVSLEDGLLSLPKVRDVKLRENFHHARGQVKVSLTELNQAKTIEKHYKLTATDELGVSKTFEVTDSVIIGENSAEFVNIRALADGGSGEIAAGQTLTWSMTDRDDNPIAGVSITNSEAILLRDFGIVEVFVDGIDFSNNDEVARVQAEIERLRAAGVFVILKEVMPVKVAGIFRIELNESVRLLADDRAQAENQVAAAIRKYILDRKMGQSLVVGQLTKNALSINGVESMDDFRLTVTRKNTALQRDSSLKREEVDEFERFYPDYICVASEIKPLPITIHFKAANLEQDYSNALAALSSLFSSFEVGSSVSKAAIVETLKTATSELDENSVELLPLPWCAREPYAGQDVAVSFVELPQLGDVFGYTNLLEITGAFKLTLPASLTEAARQNTAAKVRQAIAAYLHSLKPESAIEFLPLIQIVQQIEGVLAVEFNPDDFKVSRADVELEGRVSRDKIDVQPFEKPVAPWLCVTSGTEIVQLELAGLEIKATVAVASDDSRDDATILAASQAALLTALRNAYSNFLTQPEVGQNISYAAFSRALQVPLTDITYSLEKFSLKATSRGDGRVQITPREQDGASLEKDIHIRSVEIASLLPFNEAAVTLNIELNRATTTN